jgi:hypothetical protein
VGAVWDSFGEGAGGGGVGSSTAGREFAERAGEHRQDMQGGGFFDCALRASLRMTDFFALPMKMQGL